MPVHNYPPLGQFPIQQGWMVSRMPSRDKPGFVRINTQAEIFSGHPELPCRFGVAVPLLKPNPYGLPTEEEASALYAIEDALCAELQRFTNGFLLLVVSTNGMREFVFYVRSVADVLPALAAARQVAHGHELQHYVKEDREWFAYQQFLKSVMRKKA